MHEFHGPINEMSKKKNELNW